MEKGTEDLPSEPANQVAGSEEHPPRSSERDLGLSFKVWVKKKRLTCTRRQ